MRKLLVTLLSLGLLALQASAAPPVVGSMPYAAAGLTKEQASAHLLSRFTFGAQPGQVEAVARQGLEKWFAQQLQEAGEDPEVQARLRDYSSLTMSCRQIADTYLPQNALLKKAEEDGFVDRGEGKLKGNRELRGKVVEYARSHGLKLEREMLRDLLAQKVIRAMLSRQQLREVLTDFWFNHFNVSLTKPQARNYILTYERDAIRPHVLGPFRQLLGATAKHPAMLFYLDNAQSVVNQDMPNLAPGASLPRQGKRKRGLNENFARELLELHTMGVDGGYRQQDVVEVARALTGWTALPSNPQARRALSLQVERARKAGLAIVEQGDFIFVPAFHDAGAKTILGRSFPAGRGVEEGDEVLDLLARQPATARFIARKLVVRFVSDKPDPALVEKVARSYLQHQGEVSEMLITLVDSPEFWAPAARQAKVKSPLEYAVSMLRAVDAELSETSEPLYRWLEKMGQPLYGYQAPTGFPDRAEQWVSSGTLVNRINFAFALVSNQIPGIRVNNPVTEAGGSARQRLERLAARLMAGRDSKATADGVAANLDNQKFYDRLRQGQEEGMDHTALNETQKMMGVLLSSPDFQRR